MRLLTPCCDSPLLPQPYQCLHEWTAYRHAYPPSCWVGHRPRVVQLEAGL